ncbi:MAG: phosphate transport system permease protein [Pseudohongiellaceae bacterium]|jgi:phosphate transport system permease protein
MSNDVKQAAVSQTTQSLDAGASVLDMASNRMVLRRKLRHFYDQSASVAIAIGGVSVILAILLIFMYLFYEVLPLFESATLDKVNEYQIENRSSSTSLHLAIEEQSEIGMRIGDQADVLFFDVTDGATVAFMEIALPAGASIDHFALDTQESGIFALGLDNGEAVVARYGYTTTFVGENNTRTLTPKIDFPFGEQPYALFAGSSLTELAIRSNGDSLMVAGVDGNGAVKLINATKQTNLFSAFDIGGGDADFKIENYSLDVSVQDVEQMFIGGDQRWLYFISSSGLIRALDLVSAMNGESDRFSIQTVLTEDGVRPTQVVFLLGGISLLVADDSGAISQWFLSREEGLTRLQKAREFSPGEEPILRMTAEQRRKNFVSVDELGRLAIYNTTAHRAVFSEDITDRVPNLLALSPRGDGLLLETVDGDIGFWEVHNEHPEVSWSVLWDKVWYEGYSEPEYIWQSSASSNEFEPKYSLMPLTFGTLKAAFYAMLLAAPLAICGAIFTGYFMAPAMRRKVKPLIELMEALPTVVLGFLAGLWLAPFVEKNLLGIFSILIILPLSILAASFTWTQLPRKIRDCVPDGWEAGILIPVILVFSYLSFALAVPIENSFFNGDMRFWITNDLGISYDQRNAMVVGFAMGFAVIPTIFSIAEDAIFTVPKQLTYGSLALGATPWQSLQRVVLPTASPGIFSALMIGMGRAVGETMIVLMATGNTPIMDINIFEGMRTLAANIAVEIPESEVDSTHYRILFLAALVLFMSTFVFNTIAEVVRQRLRTKYSTI